MTNLSPIRILLVDDDEDDVVITRQLVASAVDEQPIDMVWVSDYDEAIDQMRADRYDCYLVDYRMGSRTGLDLLNDAKRIGCRRPIILLTGQGDNAVDREALRLGAADYLVKGEVSPILLSRTIRYAIAQKKMEADKEAMIHELGAALARIKTLKGLIPICAYCKKVRNDRGYWDQVELYVQQNTDAKFSHGICPDCVRREFGDEFAKNVLES